MPPKPTSRDQIWSAALRLVADDSRGPVTTTEIIEEAGLTGKQRETARRTLHAMVELGWLSHNDGTHQWSGGDNFSRHTIVYRLD